MHSNEPKSCQKQKKKEEEKKKKQLQEHMKKNKSDGECGDKISFTSTLCLTKSLVNKYLLYLHLIHTYGLLKLLIFFTVALCTIQERQYLC